MQLDDVRALKAQWRAQYEARLYEDRPGAQGQSLPWVALGVAPGAGPGDYRVAVRFPMPTAAVSAQLTQWASQARGELDLRYLGTLRAAAATVAWAQGVRRPLGIGVSVSHVRGPVGTLGAFVRRRADPGRLFALSSCHVLARSGVAVPGEAMLQPGATEGSAPDQTVGRLRIAVPLQLLEGNAVDAALVELDAAHWPEDTTLVHTLGRLTSALPQAALPGATVHKLGRSTGLTTGRISATELDELPVQFPVGLLRFEGQFEIEGADDTPCFASPGDSGALVVDDARRPTGLLFAISSHGSAYRGPAGQSLAYANPLAAVLAAVDGALAL